jgi:PAS domain S-box-containing protein
VPPLVSPLSLALVVVAILLAVVVWLAVARRRLADKLATIRRRFFACMDESPFCVSIRSADGRSIYENPALRAITRTALPHNGSFLGRTDRDFFPPEQADISMNGDREVLSSGIPLVCDTSFRDADGSLRVWSSLKFPWVDDDGETCVAGVSFERTDIHRAREAIRASEDRHALALEAGRMGTMTLDLVTQVIETSSLFARMHGRPETKTRLTLEESLAEVHPDDHRPIIEAVQLALRDQAPSRMTYRVVKPDGGGAWIELVGQVFTDDAGRPTVVRCVGIDVTERQAAYEELTRRKEMLRRLIEVQENERQTLCHELHDGMLQYAIGATMVLESVRAAAGAAGLGDRIDAAINCLTRGIAEGRQVIRGVRSGVLDDLGLAAAIQDLADQMAAVGVAVEMAVDDGIDALPASLRTTVYRVVQESLTNVRKHAATAEASVEIRRTPDEVHLCVGDRGGGFEIEAARKRGFGLVGMTERVRLAGGVCTIESQPGVGSRIRAVLPIVVEETRRPTPTAPPTAAQRARVPR